MKLAIVVRKDLGMGAGKVAVQAGHAAIIAYRASPDKADVWFNEGQKKIVLKVPDEQALLNIEQKALVYKVKVNRVIDFGLTQIAPNTLTCIAIGMDEDDKINEITKGLQLW
jgi:PTH2 family peptidyl-tRNA hydrolase